MADGRAVISISRFGSEFLACRSLAHPTSGPGSPAYRLLSAAEQSVSIKQQVSCFSQYVHTLPPRLALGGNRLTDLAAVLGRCGPLSPQPPQRYCYT